MQKKGRIDLVELRFHMLRQKLMYGSLSRRFEAVISFREMLLNGQRKGEILEILKFQKEKERDIVILIMVEAIIENEEFLEEELLLAA